MASPVIIRADDYGCDIAANAAILDCIRLGSAVKNVSVLACAPATADRVEELIEFQKRDGAISIGLHYCLNSEWSEIKWGPVSPRDTVATLVEPDGHFTPTPMTLHQRGFSLDEAERELEAQFQRLLQLGIRPDYIDEHMGVAWLPGLRDRVARFAEVQRVIYVPNLTGEQLRVFHPCYRTPTTERFWHEGLTPGAVAIERDQEAHMLSNPSYAEALAAEGRRSVTYRELALLY
ncbi:MAG: ChbG/HpnK family deacetylase [Fimbriimonadaceae bacterium]|nr:ChbG/HpnK family deacetylase [Fimbriimonadaceae bacterium]